MNADVTVGGCCGWIVLGGMCLLFPPLLILVIPLFAVLAIYGK